MALFLLQAQLPGQAKKTGPTIHKAVAPQYAGTFHPSTGLVTPGSERNRAIGNYLIVNNNRLSNYYSVPGKNQEWVDNNVIAYRSTTGDEQANGISYVYCSAETNPNGIFETIHIYDDSVYCAGPTNWPVSDCSYTVEGLPGGNNGNLACWLVVLDLYGVECNLTSGHGGSMGWGQVWDNDTSGPWIANGGLGQTDSFTWFDRDAPNANAFQGCYWFGGLPWVGFSFQLWSGPEDSYRYFAEDLGGTSTALDGWQLQVDRAVKKGEFCTFTASHPQGLPIDSMILLYSTSRGGAPYPHLGGNVLVDPTNFNKTPPLPPTASLQVPGHTPNAYTQAACFFQGSFVGFTHGLNHVNL